MDTTLAVIDKIILVIGGKPEVDVLEWIKTVDKNKAAFKLKGIPPIYYLNLDEPGRSKNLYGEPIYIGRLKTMNVSLHMDDGRGDNDLAEIIKGRYPDNMSSGEIGCTTSHLKALTKFLETDAPCALIVEDDLDLQVVRCWNFTWKDFYSLIPYDYDVIQLAIICTGSLHVALHKRFVNDFSTAAYLISRRRSAEKLVHFHVRGDKYKIDQGVKPRAVADDLIYNSGNTFSIPLFLYRIALGSSIHPEHIDYFHKSSHDGLLNFAAKWT